MKVELKIIIIAALVLTMSILFTCGFFAGRKTNERIVYVNLEVEDDSQINAKEWKYMVMDKEKSDFICQISSELGIDSDLVVAILMRENPEFNPEAIHKNENGTLDLGLAQLNSAYIWSTFKDRYWDFDFELNPFNWKHNLFIMMHHIQYLQKRLKNQDLVIQAYNCGEQRVLEDIPQSTKVYLIAVNNTLSILKGNNSND